MNRKWKNMTPARRWQLDRIEADREYKKRLLDKELNLLDVFIAKLEKGNED